MSKRDSGDEISAMFSRTFKMTGSLDTNIGKCAEIKKVTMEAIILEIRAGLFESSLTLT